MLAFLSPLVVANTSTCLEGRSDGLGSTCALHAVCARLCADAIDVRRELLFVVYNVLSVPRCGSVLLCFDCIVSFRAEDEHCELGKLVFFIRRCFVSDLFLCLVLRSAASVRGRSTLACSARSCRCFGPKRLLTRRRSLPPLSLMLPRLRLPRRWRWRPLMHDHRRLPLCRARRHSWRQHPDSLRRPR